MSRRARSLPERLAAQSGISLIMAIGVMLVLAVSTAAVVEFTTSNERSANASLDRQDALSYAEQALARGLGVLSHANREIYDANKNGLDAPDLAGSALDETPNRILPDSGSADARNCDAVTGPRLVSSGDLGSGRSWTAEVCGHLEITDRLLGQPVAGVWHLVGVGTYTHGRLTSRRVATARVPITSDATMVPSDAFQYLYSKGSSTMTCDQSIVNNTYVTSRMYVYGDLCLENSAALDGVTGFNTKLVVLGHIRSASANKPAVGPTVPISTVEVGWGCRRGNDALTYPGGTSPGGTGWELPCTWSNPAPGGGVRNSPTVTPPEADIIAPPTTDYSQFYSWSMPTAKYDPAGQGVGGCTSGSVPWASTKGGNGFDNDAVLNNSYPTLTTADLFPATAYDCTFGTASTTPGYPDPWATPIGEKPVRGRIAWDPTTNTLTVDGVIYIDGSVELSSTPVIQVNGFATIYVSGHLSFRQATLCMDRNASGTGCDTNNWDTTQIVTASDGKKLADFPMLLWVVKGDGPAADSTITPPAWTVIQQSSHVQGGIYSDQAVEIENLSLSEGPVVSLTYVIQNHSTVDYFPPISALPPGTPGTVKIRQLNLDTTNVRYGL
jgi:hypothetical protein